MKTVENKTAKLSEQETLTYGEMIMLVVKTPTMGHNGPLPLAYDDLKKIQRVDKVIGKDKLQKEFVFEDADYDFVKEKLAKMSWGYYNEEFISFTDFINDAGKEKK